MNSNHISFLVIDDEAPARQELIHALEEHDWAEVCGEAESIDEAFEKIIQFNPDALFLDIQIKKGTGFQLLQKLRDQHLDIPQVIIITGHAEFEYAKMALNKFNDCIIKIMEKPFWEHWEEELIECRDRILIHKNTITDQETSRNQQSSIFVRQEKISIKIDIHDILYLEVGGEGSTILVTQDLKNYTLKTTLNKTLNKLPEHIVRISRFQAVNTQRISRIDYDEPAVYLDAYHRGLDLSKEFKKELIRHLNIL